MCSLRCSTVSGETFLAMVNCFLLCCMRCLNASWDVPCGVEMLLETFLVVLKCFLRCSLWCRNACWDVTGEMFVVVFSVMLKYLLVCLTVLFDVMIFRAMLKCLLGVFLVVLKCFLRCSCGVEMLPMVFIEMPLEMFLALFKCFLGRSSLLKCFFTCPWQVRFPLWFPGPET